jgi:tetratricopeptide (TPR) repeat protein
MTPYWIYLLATALDKTGRTAEALGVLNDALAEAQLSDERWFDCEMYILKATLAAGARSEARHQHAQACRALRKAGRMATAIGSPSLRLRAANVLSPLLREQGKCREASVLLRTAYASFNEGFETKDLAEAREMLAQFSEEQGSAPEGTER